MLARVKRLARLVVLLYDATLANELPDVAAQLAYSSLLALFPFGIFVVTVIGFLPIDGLSDQIMWNLHRLMPGGTATLLESTVRGVVDNRHGKLLAISIAAAIWSASSGVSAFTAALNRAYAVKETRSWLRVRFQSILITLWVLWLVIIICVALIIGPRIAEWIAGWFGLSAAWVRLWSLMRWPSTVGAMSLILGLLYWACPNVHRPFRLVTAGALTAVPLWVACTLAFNLYVSQLGSFDATYGALGTGVVLLVWIYLSSLIVLVGGEMNAILDRQAHHERPATV